MFSEAEVRMAVAAISATPRQFPFYGTSRVFRRIRLRRFPYVIVYRELPHAVRVTVLKHERRRGIRYEATLTGQPQSLWPGMLRLVAGSAAVGGRAD